jgi:hypothetical protein
MTTQADAAEQKTAERRYAAGRFANTNIARSEDHLPQE